MKNTDHVTTVIDANGYRWKRHPSTGNGLVSPYFRQIGTRRDKTLKQLLKSA